MTFETLVDRLLSLFDVSQARAVDVANERLGEMVTKAESLQAITTSIGPTVAAQAAYTLPSNVAKVLKVQIGALNYEGAATPEDFWDIATGDATTNDNIYAVLPDSDSDMNTSSIQFYPAPTATGTVISALVALRPAVLTYVTATVLPIPVDSHPKLLAGCEAVLYDDDGRQELAQKKEGEFGDGIATLKGVVAGRTKGSGRHRIRVSGYDLAS